MIANRLLILDDDPNVLRFLAEVGRLARYEVKAAESPAQFLDVYETFNPSLIVLDLQYSDGDGIELLTYLKQSHCTAPILLISGFDARVLETARRVGIASGLTIVDALVKPVQPEALEQFLDAHREPEIADWADDLTVFYQPKVSVADGHVVGFEALARWIHPHRGILTPDHFIPLAEEMGLMAALSDHVLGRAIADCASWAAAGHDLTVAVNLSAAMLTRDRLLERIVQGLHQHRLPATRLTLEVTETVAMQNPSLTLATLGRLRLRGINLSLDDFGTGYSNLGLLHRMPFNELKIDKGFVTDAGANRESQVIVRTLAALAQQLGLTTVAEGVEDVELWEWLHALG